MTVTPVTATTMEKALLPVTTDAANIATPANPANRANRANTAEPANQTDAAAMADKVV